LSEICDLCRREIQENQQEVWTTDVGEKFVIPCSDELWIEATTINGDIVICLDCYRNKSLESFSAVELAEIHYEFGLEFFGKGKIQTAKNCFETALAYKVEPRSLAALGNCFEKLDDLGEAKHFWSRALAVDPVCLEARLNLERFR